MVITIKYYKTYNYKDNDKINYVSNIEDLQDLSALNDRIELKFSALKTKPDDNWNGWDSEIFYLRGHLFGLIKSYGIDILKSNLNECELINKNINKIIK